MDNLDEFMRKKFTERDESAPFEFRESHWEAAQELIRADQNKRRRRAIWWRWAGLGVLLLFVVSLCQTHQIRILFSSEKQVSKLPQTNPSTNNSTTAYDIEKNSSSTTITDNISSSTPKTSAESSSNILKSNATSDLNNSKPAAEGSNMPSNVGQRVAVKDAPTTAAKSTGQQSVTQGLHRTNKQIAAEATVPREDSKQQKALSKTPESTFFEEKTSASSENTLRKTNIQQENKESKGLAADLSGETMALPTALIYMPELMLIPEITLNVYTNASIKPYKDQTLFWGIQTQGAYYAKATYGQKDLYGGSLGLWLRYVGKNKWGISTSIDFMQLTGKQLAQDSATTSSNTIYNFGYDQKSYDLQAKSMQTIEANVALVRALRSGTAHVGLWGGKTINMRADYTETSSNSLDFSAQTMRSTVNTASINAAKPYWGLSVGYDHKLLKNVEIGFAMRFAPKGFFQNELDASTPRANALGGLGRIAWQF